MLLSLSSIGSLTWLQNDKAEDFNVGLSLSLQDYTRIPIVLNHSQSVTQKRDIFRFVAFIKEARETVVTTQAFCRKRMRDRGRERECYAFGFLLLKVSISRLSEPLSVSLENGSQVTSKHGPWTLSPLGMGRN